MNNLASTERRLRDSDEKLRELVASRIQYVPQRTATWWDVGKIMLTAAIVTFVVCLLLLWKLGAL